MTEQHHKVRIKPTVGRVVLFHLGNPNVGPYLGWGITPDGSNTYNASIVYVHNEHVVNLAADDCNGIRMGFTSIPLVQGDDERPAGNWCEWMPYQKGQAAKTEQLEASLAAADRVHRAHESGEQRFGEPPTLNTAAHAPGAHDATVTGDGTGNALPPIAARDVRGIINPELHGDSPYASSRADALAPRNPPHPAMAGLVPLDNDGNPLTGSAFDKTYDENARRRGQYEENFGDGGTRPPGEED